MRDAYFDQLDSIVADLVTMAPEGQQQVRQATTALLTANAEVAEQVISEDATIDAARERIEDRSFELLALQQPVASDLRLVSAILHVNLHLERVGDQAVNVAKIAKVTADLPSSDTVVTHLQEMGEVACGMLATAMEAFARRDVALAERLPEMDDPLDRLNRNMYREVAALAADSQLLEWGIRMNFVARQLERVGDHAVDVGEQVAFLLTGEFREFTDASHPDAT